MRNGIETGQIDRGRLTGPLRRQSVKKNVAAIHVSGKLTLLQRKLSNVLLLNAYDTLVTRSRHQIDARTLCLMVGYNSNDMDTLKQSLRSLAETVAEWDMLDAQGREEWGVSALLSYARLSGGICEYAYSPALAEKLHDPKVFALINLNIQRRFTSGHALALYENCYRFVRTGSTGWLPVDLFRRLMGVEDSDYYRTFKHLNAKIIKPAVLEVNRSSNIIVTPEFRKMGRQVSDLRFRIRDNPQLAMIDLDDGAGVRRGRTHARLIAVGVSDRLAGQWIGEHGEAYVDEKLDYLDGRTGVDSPVRYLTAALRDDYREPVAAPPPDPTPEARIAVEAARAARDVTAAADALRSAGIEAERRRRTALMSRVREVVSARTPTQRDADRRLFASGLADEVARGDFARHGWASALNVAAMVAFWTEMVPGAFDDIDAERE